MSPEEKELLNKTLALTEENNKILNSILKSMRLQKIISIVYWVFIVGSAVGAYYFIQPYLGQLVSIYGDTQNVIDQLQ